MIYNCIFNVNNGIYIIINLLTYLLTYLLTVRYDTRNLKFPVKLGEVNSHNRTTVMGEP